MSSITVSNSVCRVCLNQDLKHYRFLYEKYKDCLVFQHINAISDVKIQENDGLPDKICQECLFELDNAIHFKEKCESSNVILKSASISKPTQTLINNEIDTIVKKEELLGEDDFDGTAYDPSDFVLEANVAEIQNDSKIVEFQESLKSKGLDCKLECYDCGELFKSKCKLRVHWKKIHLPQTLKCQVCKRIFKSTKAFRNHKRDQIVTCTVAGSNHVSIDGEGKSRVFYCKHCGHKSKRIKDMRTHLVIHSGERPFQCEICSAAYTQYSSLEGHQESAHKIYKVQITCQFCGKFIKGRRRVYRHLKTHTDNRVQCDVCMKIFKNKTCLENHLKRHSGVKNYTCEKCAVAFYTGAELSNHTRTVHNKGKHIYSCDICGYKTNRSGTIKKHKNKHNDSNYPCTVCGMFFDCKQKVALHQKRHFEEKNFSCPYCERKFYRKESINQHVRTKHKCTMLTSHKQQNTDVKKENASLQIDNRVIEIEISTSITLM